MTANNKRLNIRISSCIDKKKIKAREVLRYCVNFTQPIGIELEFQPGPVSWVIAIPISQYSYFLFICLLTCFSTGDWSWVWV